MLRSTNPRLTPLDLTPYRAKPRFVLQGAQGFRSDPNGEFSTLLALRHAETLFRILRDTLSHREIAKHLCHVPPPFVDEPISFHATNAIRALFDQEHYHLGRMADTLEFFSATSPRACCEPHEYRTPSTTPSEAIIFLVLHDLWLANSPLAEVFRQTSNDDAIRGIAEEEEYLILKYPKGEATAEDELVAGYSDFFELQGQASMDGRISRGGPLHYSSLFVGAFAESFVPKVCSLIDKLGDAAFPGRDGDDEGGGGDPWSDPSPQPPPAPEPEPEPEPLSAVLSAPTGVKTGVATLFDGKGSVGAESYSFDFGDGTVIAHPNSEPTPTHTYVEPGRYEVQLEVARGNCGSAYCKYGTATATVEVEPGPLPTARFEIDADCPEDPCILPANVDVLLRESSTGTVAETNWDFGDGHSSTERDTRHSWSLPGFYRVVLTAVGLDTVSTASRDVLVRSSSPAGTCEPDPATLCLGDSRYQVRVDWVAAEGPRETARVVHAGTNDSGMFQFFDHDNWEVLVKVLEGCAVNQSVWFFAASATDIGYTIRVTDTATGAVREYRSEPGGRAAAITDLNAFPNSCRR